MAEGESESRAAFENDVANVFVASTSFDPIGIRVFLAVAVAE
jgi:hypothetical protein